MSLANLLEEKFSTDMLIKFARIRGIARYGFFQQFKKSSPYIFDGLWLMVYGL